MAFRKLSELHVDAIIHQAALGKQPTEISKLLEDGVETGDGSRLESVTVDESNVRRHITRRPDELELARYEIYGDLSREPAAHPGWRLQERRKLYDMCVEQAQASPNGSGQRAYITIAARLLADSSAELGTLAPREGTKHLHVHGGDTSELTKTISHRLRELAEGGALDAAADLLSDSPERRAN